MEECHFGLDADEHVREAVIRRDLEEDVAPVVGEALRAERGDGEGNAAEGLDGVDV